MVPCWPRPWTWGGDEAYLIAQQARPASGYPFLHITLAGTLRTDGGVNGAGLAQVNASLETTAANGDGLPISILCRDLLQRCATLEEALDWLTRFDAINHGCNIMLADTAGALAVAEKSPTRWAVHWPPSGVLFNTNHSLAPEMADIQGGSQALLDNSRARHQRLVGLNEAGKLTPELRGVRSLLRDHGSPGGLYQHGQKGLHTVCAL